MVKAIDTRELNRLADAPVREAFPTDSKASVADAQKAAREAILTKFTLEEIGSSLLDEFCAKKVKRHVKSRTIGSILGHESIDDLFEAESPPDALFEAEGIAVPMALWNLDVVTMQKRRIVDNKVEIDRAFVRSMDFMEPMEQTLSKTPRGTVSKLWVDIKKAYRERTKKKKGK